MRTPCRSTTTCGSSTASRAPSWWTRASIRRRPPAAGRTLIRPVAEGLAAIGVDCEGRVGRRDHPHALRPCRKYRAVSARALSCAGCRDGLLHRPRDDASSSVGVLRGGECRGRWCAVCSTDVWSFMPATPMLYPGVTLHHLPGHTLGLQAVRVQTGRGPVVLASDAAHFWANLERETPYPIVADVPHYLESLRTLRKLAPSIDHIIPGHDPQVLVRFPAEAGIQDIVRLDLAPLPRAPRPPRSHERVRIHRFGPDGRRHGAAPHRGRDTAWSYSTPSASARDALAAQGASIVPSARAVADAVPVVFLSLPNPEIVVETMLGAHGAMAGTRLEVCVDLSTSGPGDGDQARGGSRGTQHRIARSARFGRHQGRARRHAVVDDLRPDLRVGAGPTAARDFRPAVLHGRDRRRRPDDEARQQPAGRVRDRHHRRGHDDRRKGGTGSRRA